MSRLDRLKFDWAKARAASLTFALRGHFPGFRSVRHVPATPMFRKPRGEALPPFHTLGFLPCCCFHMFLRSTNRKKDGKNHRYFSVVENRRLPGDKTVQRTVLYLGEINDQQQAAWLRTRRKSTRLNSIHLGISYAVF